MRRRLIHGVRSGLAFSDDLLPPAGSWVTHLAIYNMEIGREEGDGICYVFCSRRILGLLLATLLTLCLDHAILDMTQAED
jgi:hypothetical protein